MLREISTEFVMNVMNWFKKSTINRVVHVRVTRVHEGLLILPVEEELTASSISKIEEVADDLPLNRVRLYQLVFYKKQVDIYLGGLFKVGFSMK